MALSREQQKILDYVVYEDRHSVLKIVFEYFEGIISEMFRYNELSLAEYFIEELLTGDWEVYTSRATTEPVIALNLKGKGFPDWDKVISEVSSRKGIDEDRIRAYCTLEFLDSLFWDEVRFNDELLEDFALELGLDFVRVGRSGGYVGALFEGDSFLAVDDEIMDELILDTMKKNKLDEKIFQTDDYEFFLSRDEANKGYPIKPEELTLAMVKNSDYLKEDIVYSLSDEIIDVLDPVFDEDLIKSKKLLIPQLTPYNSVKSFEKLEEAIKNSVKNFGEVERWVELIIANEYWESTGTSNNLMERVIDRVEETQAREISNRELADLPSDWLNPTVDTSKYYQNVLTAWEVDKTTFDKHIRAGGLGQEYQGKYYIA